MCLLRIYCIQKVHEFGHNMGVDHDHANSKAGDVALPYAYGYVSPTCGDWHTVM
jgi:hypothetical protein